MVTWQFYALVWFVQVIMLVGLIGLFLPLFSGVVLVWLGALIYGLLYGFDTAGIIIFVIQTLLMLAGVVVDNILMGVGAHRGGASCTTIVVALTAGVIGTIIFPPFGGFIGAPLAVLVLEYIRLGDWREAWYALRGLVAGWGLSYLARLAIGIAIMVLWWLWVWIGWPV